MTQTLSQIIVDNKPTQKRQISLGAAVLEWQQNAANRCIFLFMTHIRLSHLQLELQLS